MDKSGWVSEYLERTGRFPAERMRGVAFLAAGEYNENYLVTTERGPYVLRINHGSQLGLAGQIGYEFRVLKAVEASGVTPKAFWVDTAAPLGHGVLLMEYLPGKPLDYETDLGGAARVLARVHALPPDPGLVVQADPVGDIAAESLGLIERYPENPLARQKDMLLGLHRKVSDLGREHADELTGRDGGLVMVNTEINSGNFLVDDGAVRLTDWEKAVISHRCQDLGHFLAPTTTLWKTDYVFTPEARRAFLVRYVAESAGAGGARLDLERLDRATAVLERAVLLRGLSWSYMAHYEYTKLNRTLSNPDTLRVINRYMDEMEWFLRQWA